MLPSRKFDKRVNGYIIHSFTTDPSVLRLGQQLDIMFNTGVPSAQISSYLVLSRFRYLAMTVLGGFIIKFLTKYELGRNLLLKYPRFFSFGNYNYYYFFIMFIISLINFNFYCRTFLKRWTYTRSDSTV
jgi:hypothetical protein